MAASKEQTLSEINRSWFEFQELVSQTPIDRMRETPAVGDWSVNDLLGHIATWEVETMDSIRQFLDDPNQGIRKYSDEEIDVFNRDRLAAKGHMGAEDLLLDLEETHARLMAYLASLPQEAFQQADIEWRIRLDTSGHYQEHGVDLRRWLSLPKQ